MNKYKDLEMLKEQLINGEEIIPNVYGTEASAGKTTTACIGMVEAYNKNKRKSQLITKERLECIEIVKKCNEIAGENIAKAFISVKKEDDIDETLIATTKDLKECPIIVSTHSRYVDALKYMDDKYSIDFGKVKKTESYIENFNNFKNFVIDEQIDLVKNTYFSISIGRLSSLLNSAKEYDGINMYERFNNFLLPLSNYIAQYKLDKNKLTRCNLAIELENEWIEARAVRQAIFSLKTKNESLIGFEIEEIENIINGVSLIYRNLKSIGVNSLSTVVLYMDKDVKVATYNHRVKLLLSENNSILDASSPFMSIYDNKDKFKKITTERLVDHSNCNLRVHIMNTSTSSYREDLGNVKINYILKDIEKYSGQSLVISKDNFKKIYSEYGFENFETAKAKNTYKDHDNVFITHTSRMELPYYVFCCDYYNNKITRNISYATKTMMKVLEFDDEVLNDIYKGYTADLWYQGIKRIQRNTEPKANYIFYTNDTLNIATIYKQLAGIGKPEVCNVEEKLTVFMRLLYFIQEEWSGNRLYTSDLEIILSCTNKTVLNALDKCEELNVFEELGITKGRNNGSLFIESKELKSQNYYSDFEILQKELKKVEKKTNKRKVSKMDKIVDFLEQYEGGFMFEADIKKFVKLIGGIDRPSKVNKNLEELNIDFRILNQPSHGKKRWKVERDHKE